MREADREAASSGAASSGGGAEVSRPKPSSGPAIARRRSAGRIPDWHPPPPQLENGEPQAEPIELDGPVIEGREGGEMQVISDGEEQDEAAPPRRGRGPDRQPRRVIVRREAGVNPEAPDDWSNFDIGRVVRLFRANRPGHNQLSLRKLHVRWWHASEATMEKFLKRVGVTEEVIKLIPEVCKTCKVCRQWEKPGPASAPQTFRTLSISKLSVTSFSRVRIPRSTKELTPPSFI